LIFQFFIFAFQAHPIPRRDLRKQELEQILRGLCQKARKNVKKKPTEKLQKYNHLETLLFLKIRLVVSWHSLALE
jgi:hypothetical protein